MEDKEDTEVVVAEAGTMMAVVSSHDVSKYTCNDSSFPNLLTKRFTTICHLGYGGGYSGGAGGGGYGGGSGDYDNNRY